MAPLSACGGGSESPSETGHTVETLIPESQLLPIIISTDLAVGQNRFVLGLIDQTNDSQVLGADLHLRFFSINGQNATLEFEKTPEAIRLTKAYTHTHDDGTIESHEAGETGAYVAQVIFRTAGTWGVDITGTAGGAPIEGLRPTFSVIEDSPSPSIGEPAPRSVQKILSDVANISEIDTSVTPIPEMHDKTIAAAVTSGKPTVIVFATPAFCVSQICGPAKDFVDELYAANKASANFIHVEPYDLAKARSGAGLEPLAFISDEWGLQSEPWVFFVDRGGNIAAKFEGLVSADELAIAMGQVLG